MSGATQLSTSAFTAYLVVGGTRYVLTSFNVQYISNGISAAMCDLAVGFAGSSVGGVGAPGNFKPLRGTPAQVLMSVTTPSIDPVSGVTLLNAGDNVIFDGLVDDSGPGNLSRGMFNLRVRLMSKLGILATGTLQLGKLVPRTYLDVTVPLIRNGAGAQNISPTGSNFTPQGLQADFWKEMQRIFTDIAGTGTTANAASTQALQEYIAFLNASGTGDGPNTAAINIIKSINGSLLPGTINNGSTLQAIATYLNSLFTTDYRMESFLNRIVNLGQEFKYRIFENMQGVNIVPYSPFFPTELAREIGPSTIFNANWTNREPNSVLGCVTTLAGVNLANAHDTSHQPYLIGKYLRPVPGTNSPLGNIVSWPAPNWLAAQNLVDGSTYNFSAPLEITTKIADAWTKEMALEMGYRGYSLALQCPLRLDIGVLDPVHVIYPNIPGLGGESIGPGVYGSVQLVSLSADAVAKTATTTLEVAYVRSEALQTAEMDGYTQPIWTTQYAGGRLDTGAL